MNKLEIGPSLTGTIGPEWKCLDCVPKRGSVVMDYVGDLTKPPLPIEDDQFDLVYSSHVLEHLLFEEALPAIKEMRRICRPGGAVEIFVPDFRPIVEAYYRKQCAVSMEEINLRIFNRGIFKESRHHSCWDSEALERIMRDAGLKEVQQITEPRGKVHQEETIGARGIK